MIVIFLEGFMQVVTLNAYGALRVTGRLENISYNHGRWIH